MFRAHLFQGLVRGLGLASNGLPSAFPGACVKELGPLAPCQV